MNYFVLKMPPFSFMPVINHKSFYILITQAVCLKIRVGGQGEKRIEYFFFLAYGGSQAGGPTGAVAAGLRHSHSNARSKPSL